LRNNSLMPNDQHRLRARAYGVAYEGVKPAKIFIRDNWHCQVCGCETPSSLRGTRDDRAPELGHKRPISKGGPHTYENIQCECRACNNSKGDSTTATLSDTPQYKPLAVETQPSLVDAATGQAWVP
jgi:5-methylcytosine-specific restriction endonuclease McrA